MGGEVLTKIGADLVKRYKTRDPFRMAREMGIEVMFCEKFGMLKGMYRVIKRNRFIFINKDLGEQMQKIVCAHEIGHDCLHRKLAASEGINELCMYDMTTKPEYEANIIASEILLDTEEILNYVYEAGYTASQIASVMNTDVNLVALKLRHLAQMGYDVRSIDHKDNFLKGRG